MVANGYIDKEAQKAFINGVNGCVEHIQVLQEILQHAKAHNRTVHISLYDLADAFGSVSHSLIPITLKHFNVPNSLINYINDLYTKLEGRVITRNWTSDPFKF